MTEVEFFITVLLPDRKSRVGGKLKSEKQELLKLGPITVQFNVEWENFLVAIAGLLEVAVNHIVTRSMEWHFLKPQNSPWLPLNSSASMQSMFGQVKGKKDKASSIIVLRMAQPLQLQTPTNLVSLVLLLSSCGCD
jgi:hypothetical protein